MFINCIHISLYTILSIADHFISTQKRRGCMEETRMPPAYAANLVANCGNTIYEVYSTGIDMQGLLPWIALYVSNNILY